MPRSSTLFGGQMRALPCALLYVRRLREVLVQNDEDQVLQGVLPFARRREAACLRHPT